jgi:hypothetical protein
MIEATLHNIQMPQPVMQGIFQVFPVGYHIDNNMLLPPDPYSVQIIFWWMYTMSRYICLGWISN